LRALGNSSFSPFQWEASESVIEEIKLNILKRFKIRVQLWLSKVLTP
jgi:hypothetical protein